jgi:protein involved in polysaccharide export with SLBB domain
MTRLVVAVAVALPSGCAAVTNPVADGVPVRRLPAEVLGRSKAELVDLPLNLLRLPEPDAYRLDKGDVLAVVAGDLFGPETVPPPVNLPQFLPGGQESDASVGYPVPVREDGTIALPSPKIPPLQVRGKTVAEVEEMVRRAVVEAKLFRENQARVSVQLQKRRRYLVTVIREDTQPVPTQSAGGVITQINRRNGIPVSLEAYRNDVLRALTLSGGPPGLDARNEVLIRRGQYDPACPEKGLTKIPLRVYPEQPIPLSPADVTLNEGDILIVPSRENEVFYTAGIIGSRQIALPRDYDLDVLQAIALVGGPLANGGFTQNAFIAQAFATGLGNPSPALVTVLRQLPNGQQLPIRVDLTRALRDRRERVLIRPNDVLVMQEKPGDAVVRYLTQQFRFNTVADTIRSESINQTLTSTVP